ncbi:MAG TPA: hypothetical protein VGK43_00895 [Solirubrobacterales bacterium]
MTLITGLQCSDAVVLGSDSQITLEGGLKAEAPKLFCSPHGIIWGISGRIAACQAVEAHFKKLIAESNPDRDSGRDGVRKVMRATAKELEDADGEITGGPFQGLFAWYSKPEDKFFLLKARSDGIVEFQGQGYGAVGSPSSNELARFAFYGFSSSGHLEYETLPLETAKMLVHTVTDDAVNVSAYGVDGPIQLAVVTATGAEVLGRADLKPVQDTAAAFKMHQADFLKRADSQTGQGDVSGLDPDAKA